LGSGDLFVSPGFNASLSRHHHQLITVHDLIHLHVKAESSHTKRLYYQRIVLPAIRSAQQVLTVSQFSRNELIEWTGLPAEAIVVVGNGCSLAPATSAELDRGAAASRTTILFVGNSKPHKNLSLLIAALRHMNHEVRVVTVGIPPERITEECEAYGVQRDRVSSYQGISDAELRELYVTAACVALPSTYEGFGLVALEGMAVGTPTAYVCEAIGELVGSLGFRSGSPTDAEAYAGALTEAMEQKPLLANQLLARASTFSWDDVARKVESAITEFDAFA